MLGYMGPAGTFTQQAAIEWSQGREELREFPTIASAIKAVDREEIERCIVPIENSLNGSVTMTLDTLAFNSDVYITGEHILSITQNLVVKKGASVSDIKTIMSHPQESDGSVAAIAPAAAAAIYGLEIVRPACNDESNNFTRFVIIEKTPSFKVSDHDKTSIVFSTAHVPGALYEAIGLLGHSKINMLKIESRPVKNEMGKYVFFIDIEGNVDDAGIYFALEEVKEHSLFYKNLGSYHYE